jgi:UDP-N-acetylglucosamine:LPS N-acetylglucosamine transferase
MPRVLIFTADIGAGHDLPAARLADALGEHGAETMIVDSLEAVGGLLRWAIRDSIESVLHEHPEVFDAQFRLLQRPRLREGANRIALRLGGPNLLAEVEKARADVVVSTYPGATELLGRLRLDGRLKVPLVSAITDLAALRFWAHRGVDLHLLIHPESEAEVEAIAGPHAWTAVVRGLSDPAFDSPPATAQARAALGLQSDRPVIAVSGGGWGVGDLDSAAATARATGASVVILCGSNDALRERMAQAFGDDDAVLVLGFTDRMPEVLSAADALIHSTAGLTVLEAIVCGARPISFGWGVGHIRVNNRAYAATGLADVAADTTQLAAALHRALADPPAPDASYGRRGTAAGAVLALLEAP